MPIYFYSTQGHYGCFSNFSAHGIELDDKWWPTTEHYFQAQKFASTDTDSVEAIRLARTPKEAAQMGRDRKRPLQPDWNAVKDDVMRRTIMKKFQAHASLCDILLSTGSEIIIENAPGDYYWGCGKDGSGQNMLGRILMEVRETLRR